MNRKQVIRVVSLLIVSLAVVGCGAKHKVLKSNNPQLIYDYAFSLYEQESWSKAATMLDAAAVYYSGSNKEDSILFYSARAKFKARDLEEATTALDEFRRKFGRSVFLEEAEGLYTLSFYQMAPAATRDYTVTKQAIAQISEYLSRYPESDKRESFEQMREDLMGRLHEKSYKNAYTYYKIGRYKSAIVSLRNALKEYPDSRYREDILYYLVLSSYDLARNSVEDKREDRYMQTVDLYYSFLAEFPESQYRPQLDRILERSKGFVEDKKIEKAATPDEGFML